MEKSLAEVLLLLAPCFFFTQWLLRAIQQRAAASVISTRVRHSVLSSVFNRWATASARLVFIRQVFIIAFSPISHFSLMPVH